MVIVSKFFKPGDFKSPNRTLLNYEANWIATQANEKLEREGKVVIGKLWPDGDWTRIPSTNKALIINIELIEKCEHPKEKITAMPYGPAEFPPAKVYVCECGARVQPESFKEVK